jgi:transposase
LSEFLQISRTVLYEIITRRLGYHKFWARWAPKMLTGAHETQRMSSAFVDLFRAIRQRLQWISQSHPTSNRWCKLGFIRECWNEKAVKAVEAHIHQTSRRSLNKHLSARKLRATVFWDRKGVLMVELMQKGTTLTSGMYCETLKKLRRAIQNRGHGMLTYGVVILHDGALPRTVARTWQLLERFNWELFDHPPYSPDLAPNDYHLFTHLKNWLRSQRFNNNELMKGLKCGWAHRRQTSLRKAYKKLFLDTSASFLAVTTLRSSISMYIFFVKIFISRCLFISSSLEFTFWVTLIC